MVSGYKVFPVGPLAVNSTVLYSQGEAFIFDPGGEEEKLLSFLREKRLTPKAIFLTHGHIDHFARVKALKGIFPEIPVYMNERDRFLLSDELWEGFAQYLGAELNPPVDHSLKEGDSFNLGNLTVEVYETPGHTPGSVVYYIPQMRLLIAGDLLFRGSVGRWDLPGGNREELVNSVGRVLTIFPEETKVVTGHGELTTVGFEKKHNPLAWGL